MITRAINLFLLLLSFKCWSQKPVTIMLPSGFKKTTLTREFISEGATIADLNRDGKMDIVAGYYWFEAPTWKIHQMHPANAKQTESPTLGFGMFSNVFNPEKNTAIRF